MNRKLIIIIVIIVMTVIIIFTFAPQGWEAKMISPFSGTVQTPVPSPTSIKKEFKFDSATDLNKELDSVNPQVLDSDFE